MPTNDSTTPPLRGAVRREKKPPRGPRPAVLAFGDDAAPAGATPPRRNAPGVLTNPSAVHWAVRGAMLRLDRAGVYPSGDRVAADVDDYPEKAVRKARLAVLASGWFVPATPHDGPVDADGRPAPEPDPGDMADDGGEGDDRPLGAGPPGGRVDDTDRAFNVALYRIVKGEPGLLGHLSVVTGLTPNAIKSRVKRINLEHNPGEPDPAARSLSLEEARYYRLRFGDSDDPRVRAWLASHTPSVRPHPDRKRFRNKDAAGAA